MNISIKYMAIAFSLIAGSQAMEVEKSSFEALSEKNIKILILADAAPYYCFRDGHAGELASVCTDWYKLINLPAFNHPFYKTPVTMQHYCLFNIYKTLKLVYKPNKDNNNGMKEIGLSDIVNSSGEFNSFNIKECENADKYLRITPGYKKVIPTEKESKVQISIVLRSDIEKELGDGKAKHFEAIFKNWKKSAPIGIFWTWDGWDDINWMDYLITENFSSMSNNNLYEKWRGPLSHAAHYLPFIHHTSQYALGGSRRSVHSQKFHVRFYEPK